MKQLLALVLGLGLATNGCATQGAGRGYRAHAPEERVNAGDVLGAAIGVGLIALGADWEGPSDGEVVPPPPTRVEESYVNPPIPGESPPVPQTTEPDSIHVRFDPTAAAVAVHDVDLSSCVERGVPRAYGHARVTFGSSGAASRVVVDSPANLSADAVECLGEKLGQASAPPFDGTPVTIGTSFYVR